MFIIATCVNATNKRVLAYEVVSSVPASLSSNQYSINMDSGTIPDGFYESFDKFTVKSVNGNNELVQISGSTLDKRYLPETTAALKSELGKNDGVVNAILDLPWTVERINKIRNISVL